MNDRDKKISPILGKASTKAKVKQTYDDKNMIVEKPLLENMEEIKEFADVVQDTYDVPTGSLTEINRHSSTDLAEIKKLQNFLSDEDSINQDSVDPNNSPEKEKDLIKIDLENDKKTSTKIFKACPDLSPIRPERLVIFSIKL